MLSVLRLLFCIMVCMGLSACEAREAKSARSKALPEGEIDCAKTGIVMFYAGLGREEPLRYSQDKDHIEALKSELSENLEILQTIAPEYLTYEEIEDTCFELGYDRFLHLVATLQAVRRIVDEAEDDTE